MDANERRAVHIRVKNVIKNLEKNNFKAVYVETKEEALTLVKTIVEPSSYTSSGGSMTLIDTGIMDYLKKETDYHEDRRDAYRAQYYLSSCNAITDSGEIYQVDGRGNRVSAILFGPEKVILVAGINKLVPSLRGAVERVKNIASPSNCIRLSRDTPCSKLGHCISPLYSEDHIFSLGCESNESICSSLLVMRREMDKDRITVIIVGESLGY